LSDLINSKQLTRESALSEIEKETYPKDLMARDLSYVKKKLGFSDEEFTEIMNSPIKSFKDYPNNYSKVQFLRKTINILRFFGLYFR